MYIAPSAHRHGVTDDDMLHAIRQAIAAFDIDDDMVMYVGPSFTGVLLEVGVVDERVVVHAMTARDKYLGRL